MTLASSTCRRIASPRGGRSSRNAVGHVGLIGALRRISDSRTHAQDSRREHVELPNPDQRP